MELLRQTLGNSRSIDVREALEAHLKDLPVLQQLDLLTELLTASSEVDERFSEVIYAAWGHICENDLWSFKYESLEQYRQFISYGDLVRPILQRFKRSDRAKFTSISVIEQYWGMPVTEVIPEPMAPRSWSKHLLSLLASLSREISRDEAISLLAASIRQRPQRSRHVSHLIPSDVQRVLDRISCSNGSKNVSLCDDISPWSFDVDSAGRTFSSTKIEAHSDYPAEIDTSSSPIFSSSTTTDRSAHTAICSPAPVNIDRYYSDDEGQPVCHCLPICFPLVILMSVHMPRMTDGLILGLFRWAQEVSWSSLCSYHLRCLASYKCGDDVYFLSRAEIVHRLEEFILNDLTLAHISQPTIANVLPCFPFLS